MTVKEKKELITRLYRTTEFAQAKIESKLDELSKIKNDKDFDVMLINLIEISAKLLRGNY